MKPNDTYKTLRSFTYQDHTLAPITTNLLVESPLEIIINEDRRILVMITPEMIRELVCGFLFTEGLISGLSEIESLTVSSEMKGDGERIIEARVTIPSRSIGKTREDAFKRISYSSCGICGKENYYDLKRGIGRVKSRHRFSMEVLRQLPSRLEACQPLYIKTGGAHAAVLFDSGGEPIFRCEDMGRHNALDKVIGYSLIKGIAREDKVLVSSGRASLEMILKTARAGFPVFVAMSRPTSRAVEAAKFYNITLLDMAKGSNRVYTHVRRVEAL